jgi:hypothetical protein
MGAESGRRVRCFEHLFKRHVDLNVIRHIWNLHAFIQKPYGFLEIRVQQMPRWKTRKRKVE